MKRLGLTLVAAVCLTATTFAAENQPTTTKWDGSINVSKLSRYLNLADDQHAEVTNICEYFSTQMEKGPPPQKKKKKKKSIISNDRSVYLNIRYAATPCTET